jgi:SAM-dependent methyltransferase
MSEPGNKYRAVLPSEALRKMPRVPSGAGCELAGLQILLRSVQNREARRELRRRDLDCLGHPVVRALRRRGLLPGMNVGDCLKSWDVLRTVELLETRLERTAPVLDIGAYASEILCILHRAGFGRLSGIDLDPRVVRMPHAGAIQYRVGDLLATPFPSESFMAVTAISVIEHGFDAERFLTEVSRLLAPGGVVVGSTDYWETKVDTSGIAAFGMPWRIFSKEELADFLKCAGSFGLLPLGPLTFECDERVVQWNGKSYTFAWFALEKSGT